MSAIHEAIGPLVSSTNARARAQLPADLRPSPATLLGYLTVVLLLEAAAEVWLGEKAPLQRILAHSSLIALATAPIFGLIVWRSGRAERELHGWQKRDLIRRLALVLATEQDPARVRSLMVRHARELSGARLAFLAQPDGEAFRVETVAGDDAHRLAGQRLPIHQDSVGLAGQALRTGQPAVLSNTWCEAGLAARRELALSDRVRSAAAVPLLVRGAVVGLIGLHADAPGALDEKVASQLELYVAQAAVPYQNALLAANVNRLNAAEQLDQLKSEFLSAVAHELRAPLAPMLGWAELLLTREYSAEQAKPMLEQIHDGAQHLSVLVGDLLDLSRGEAGRLALDVQDLDLADLIETAADRWREHAPEHQVVAAVARPLPARADRHRLRQVLDNLLSNAVKYSPSGTRIFITARTEPGGLVMVRITDQGLGLTEEECERLFAKFYRTEAGRKFASGTGLGLALCRLILEAHGGEIGVESEGPGFGSAFTFSLPSGGPPADSEHQPPVAEFAAIKS